MIIDGSGDVLRDDPIVLANVGMLNGRNFYDEMNGESIGANAGSTEIDGKRVQCMGINGYADKQTGRITIFGGIQNIDPAIVQRDSHFILTIALPLIAAVIKGEPLAMKIIEIHRAEEMDAAGKAKLAAAAAIWNTEQAATAR